MTLDDALKRLYESVSDRDGCTIQELNKSLSGLYSLEISEADRSELRVGAGKFKKLRDEISVVARYFSYRGILVGRVKFQLSSEIPDCWFMPNDNGRAIGIEVTKARGRDDYEISKELSDRGSAPGFLGLPENASKRDFENKLSQPRQAYSTREAISVMHHGIQTCIEKKKDSKFQGMILVIGAALNIIPTDRWNDSSRQLRDGALKSPFDEIHVVSDAENPGFGFQIK